MRKMNQITKTQTSVVLSAAVNNYVQDFNAFANKSAEAVLEMCRVIYKANKELASVEFEAFASEINLKLNSSTISKWKTIGEKFDMLQKYKDHLPCAWTTLYNLCRVSEQKLSEGITDRKIFETMTNIDLRKFAPEVFPNKSRSPVIVSSTVTTIADDILYSIKSRTQLDQTKIKALFNEVSVLCNQYDCEVI